MHSSCCKPAPESDSYSHRLDIYIEENKQVFSYSQIEKKNQQLLDIYVKEIPPFPRFPYPFTLVFRYICKNGGNKTEI